MELTGLTGPQPSDIVAYESRLPSGLQVLIGRGDHGQIGLTARTWKSRRQIGLGSTGAL